VGIEFSWGLVGPTTVSKAASAAGHARVASLLTEVRGADSIAARTDPDATT
jgi:hypothetical protein